MSKSEGGGKRGGVSGSGLRHTSFKVLKGVLV